MGLSPVQLTKITEEVINALRPVIHYAVDEALSDIIKRFKEEEDKDASTSPEA